jgi:type VI protein secretion system component Hcp
MKVKIFTNQGDAPKLEEEINRWLSEKSVSLSYSHIKQSYVYDGKNNTFCALISVWYEPQFEK